MKAFVTKGGVTLQIHAVKVSGDGQKKLMIQRDKFITQGNWGATPVKYAMDVVHVTEALTITGYINTNSYNDFTPPPDPLDTNAYTTLNRLIAMMTGGGPCDLKLTNNADSLDLLDWSSATTGKAYLTKFSYSSEPSDTDIPTKYMVIASFMKAIEQ